MNYQRHSEIEIDLHSETVTVRPDLARTLRDTCAFDRQRTLRPDNIRRLAAEMVAGRFTPGTQIYFCVLPDSKKLIINGNHTLEAIVESGVPQLLTFTYKRVANEDEAGRIYAVFDLHKLRTWHDSLKATGRGKNVADPEKVLAAMGVIERRFGTVWQSSNLSVAASRLARIDALDDYLVAADLFHQSMLGCERYVRALLLRAGITAVALTTLREQPTFAFTFWQTVAAAVAEQGTPEHALLRYLRNNRLQTGAQGQQQMARAAAAAWNAAFRGQGLQSIKPSAMKGFYLLGTTYDKGLPDE